ncbi:hypothetical protein, partial [Rhizobium mesoamericanum]|uniref:hypothetical protein n=1 Tax=Rhizobium mesoamericanum TaxID=1079800 RepID=UPI00142F25CC
PLANRMLVDPKTLGNVAIRDQQEQAGMNGASIGSEAGVAAYVDSLVDVIGHACAIWCCR